jgi:hypothetical protein
LNNINSASSHWRTYRVKTTSLFAASPMLEIVRDFGDWREFLRWDNRRDNVRGGCHDATSMPAYRKDIGRRNIFC